MKSSWERHDGKTFFFARYDRMSIAEVREEVAAVQKEMDRQPADSVLLLVDPRHTFMSPEAVELFKNVARDSKTVLHKTAVLGFSGPKRWVLDIVSRFSGLAPKPFDDEEAAKEWLVAS